MDLFNKNDKYNIDEQQNISHIANGIPDNLRKEWEQEDKNKNGENIFTAFEGGYFGPSYYYFVNKINNSYQFRFGFSNDGRRVINDVSDPNLKWIDQNEKYYKMFIEELLHEVKDWNESYNDNNIMDGTQWNINIVENSKRYYGSNAFPDNYKEVVEILKKNFNVEQFIKNESQKCEVKPEEINARKCGKDLYPENKLFAPDDFNLSKKEKQLIKINVRNDKSDYILLFNKYDDQADFVFGDINNLDCKDISDISINIPFSIFDEFYIKLDNLINNWDESYNGTSLNYWSIKIETNKTNKLISGNGGFPNNWNQFIDLLIEYEMLFKKKKNADIEEIEDKKKTDF